MMPWRDRGISSRLSGRTEANGGKKLAKAEVKNEVRQISKLQVRYDTGAAEAAKQLSVVSIEDGH